MTVSTHSWAANIRLRGLTLLAAFVYVAGVLIATKYFISERFAYQGYVGRDFRWPEICVAFLVTVFLVTLARTEWAMPSHAAFAFLLATIAMPVIWIPVFYGPLDAANLIVLQLGVVSTFGVARLMLVGGRRPLRLLPAPSQASAVLIALFTVGALTYLLVGQQLQPTLATLSEVYDLREEYAEKVGTLGSYLVGALGNGVFPVALALGLHRRSARLVLTGIVGTMLLYSITGFKAYLVGLILTVVAFCLVKWWKGRGAGWFVGLTAAISLACLCDLVSGTLVPTSLLVRRAITTAGINTAYYVDFFATRPTYGLRHSIFSFLGPAPYPAAPARIIGAYYYDMDGTAANANLIADGFANFGLIGCLVAGAFLGFCLRIYDRLTTHLPLPVSVAALTFILLAFANTAPLTILATHGGLVLCIVVASVSADRAVKAKRPRRVRARLTGSELDMRSPLTPLRVPAPAAGTSTDVRRSRELPGAIRPVQPTSAQPGRVRPRRWPH